jgi:hypothetical protein
MNLEMMETLYGQHVHICATGKKPFPFANPVFLKQCAMMQVKESTKF